MINRLMVSLLGCALLSSLGSNAAYEGPNDPPTMRWEFKASQFAGCGSNATLFSNLLFSEVLAKVDASCGAGWKIANSNCGGSCADAAYAARTEFTFEQYAFVTSSTRRYFLVNASNVLVQPGVILGISQSCASSRVLFDLANTGVKACVSTCIYMKDTQVSAFVPIDDPAQNVLGACLLETGAGVCEIEPADTLSNFTYGSQLYRGGTWAYTGSRCTEDPTSPPTAGAVSSNPVGVTGGGSTTGGTSGGLSATDSANLAATKTAGEASLTKLTDIKAGQCGGTGQPVCAVATDETGVASVGASTSTAMDASKAAMEGQMNSITGALSTSPPDFGAASRWQFSLTGFLPAASCTVDIPFGKFGVEAFHISVCSWGGTVKAFLSWVVGALTSFGIWFILFKGA